MNYLKNHYALITGIFTDDTFFKSTGFDLEDELKKYPQKTYRVYEIEEIGRDICQQYGLRAEYSNDFPEHIIDFVDDNNDSVMAFTFMIVFTQDNVANEIAYYMQPNAVLD